MPRWRPAAVLELSPLSYRDDDAKVAVAGEAHAFDISTEYHYQPEAPSYQPRRPGIDGRVGNAHDRAARIEAAILSNAASTASEIALRSIGI